MRFSLGAPRSARVIAQGDVALFLRSAGECNTQTALWASWFRQGTHQETLLADPQTLMEQVGQRNEEDIPDAERARRERARESAAGIVSYSTSADGTRVVFALDGNVWLTDIDISDVSKSQTRLICADTALPTPIVMPQISPDGELLAYSTGESVVIVELARKRSGKRAHKKQADNRAVDRIACVCTSEAYMRTGNIAGDTVNDTVSDAAADAHIQVGLAEFAAGEEMDRYEGFWWSPDSQSILIERADESPEPVWWIADPAHPDHAPRATRYPRALTQNADVRLYHLDFAHVDSHQIVLEQLPEVVWDHSTYEYLAAVSWTVGQTPILHVQNREQNADQVLAVALEGNFSKVQRAKAGHHAAAKDSRIITTEVLQEHKQGPWMDLIHGVPALTTDGVLISAKVDMETDTVRLTADGEYCTPAGWQILDVLSVDNHAVVARATRDPRGVEVVRFALGADVDPCVLSQQAYDSTGRTRASEGVWTASLGGNGMVFSGRTMTSTKGHMVHVYMPEHTQQHSAVYKAQLADYSADLGFEPNTHLVHLGKDQLCTAITLPSAGSAYANADTLPVLMRPYGGPMHREVMFSLALYADSQWWADQGFIVVSTDGHGTGARGPKWDYAIKDAFADVTLADQIAAVQALPDALAQLASETHATRISRNRSRHAAAAHIPQPDLARVAIMGWSYGGYLSALAVLRASDVFAVACAGAPPTDWTLYDTHYTERYLGLDPQVYEKNSLLHDAPQLSSKLMLIHGFADDNVTVAHSLLLSQALLAAGKDHTVLPLNGITHMPNDPAVAQNLLLLQRDFMLQAL